MNYIFTFFIALVSLSGTAQTDSTKVAFVSC